MFLMWNVFSFNLKNMKNNFLPVIVLLENVSPSVIVTVSKLVLKYRLLLWP